jgi:hypothetical protein
MVKNKKGIGWGWYIFITIFLLIAFSQAMQMFSLESKTESQTVSAGNPDIVMSALKELHTGGEKGTVINTYEFEARGASGKVKMWFTEIGADVFYAMNEGNKKDFVNNVGRANNIICASNSYPNGCSTEFYSSTNRLIAEFTIFGNIKLH